MLLLVKRSYCNSFNNALHHFKNGQKIFGITIFSICNATRILENVFCGFVLEIMWKTFQLKLIKNQKFVQCIIIEILKFFFVLFGIYIFFSSRILAYYESLFYLWLSIFAQTQPCRFFSAQTGFFKFVCKICFVKFINL